MRKNGFTLIELLAVIVILAIIALIATPIILGIINDAREESNERSVELYASAVRNGIAAYQLRTGKEVEAKTYTKGTLPFEVEYDGKVDCENVIISETGKVSLDKCTVNGGTKKYSYGIDEESTVTKVCSITRQDASKYSVGDVVTCNIGETPDKFYVIEDAELNASTIQMLTEKNIHTTGYRQSDAATGVGFSNTCYWEDENYNLLPEYGSTYPVDVYDERNDIVKPIVDKYVSYLNTKLTNAEGSLLTYRQIEKLGCSGSNYSCDNTLNWVDVDSYWIGAACASGKISAVGKGFGCDNYDGNSDGYKVRPVITISTSEIQ